MEVYSYLSSIQSVLSLVEGMNNCTSIMASLCKLLIRA